MDLPCPEWVRHVEQKWTELKTEGTDYTFLNNNILPTFCHLSIYFSPEDLNTFSRISEKYSVKKSPERASEYRQQGNLSFKVKDYTTATLYYSRGVCHADKNTEELSLCYANRSAALFYQGLYRECLEDIRRSLEAGYPSHLQDKLRAKQTACLNQLKKPEKSNQPTTNHPTPPCQKSRNTKNCISPEKGRYILTTEKFVLIPGNKLNTMTNKAGKTFNTEDRHCHHCLSQSPSFVPCPNCSYIRYCGERCQKDAWERWHQWECPIGADLLAIGVLGHLALRVALKAGQNQVKRLNPGDPCRESSDHIDCYHGNSYMGIYSLLPHVAHHSPSSRFLLAVTMALLYMRLQGGPPPDMWASCEDEGESETWQPEMRARATALRHMMQLRCNTQAVTAVMSSSEIRIATAIFPVLSLLNHSCSPNTSISFTTVTVRRLLLEQYYFHCNCQACQRDLTEGSKNATENSHMDRYLCSGPSCGHQITNADVQNKLKDEALKILTSDTSQANSILTETHPLQGDLADVTARVYATTGEWNLAASHLKRSIVAIQAQFGEDSIELGQQLFKLAQLHFNDCGAALSVIPRAHKLLSLHCGPHCEELQELQEMKRCLQGLL
uniref:SET and MYND domain containing 4 n=1 Tax=Sinocyclocheilus rhinocerous TaxID=307959 RepID=A0A673FPL0_9TELE